MKDGALKNTPQTAFPLLEEMLELIENRLFRLLVRLEILGFIKFRQGLLLRRAQALRNIDTDVHQQIARPVAVDRRQALIAQTKHLARLRTRLDFHFRLPVDCRYLDRPAQSGLRHAQEQVIQQVVIVADQFGMRFLLDQDQQVAINAAMPCGVTLPAHGELHALGHARRDVDRDDIVVANNALAITSRALLYDNLALATTSRTGRLRLHLAQDGIGDTGNDTRWRHG